MMAYPRMTSLLHKMKRYLKGKKDMIKVNMGLKLSVVPITHYTSLFNLLIESKFKFECTQGNIVILYVRRIHIFNTFDNVPIYC